MPSVLKRVEEAEEDTGKTCTNFAQSGNQMPSPLSAEAFAIKLCKLRPQDSSDNPVCAIKPLRRPRFSPPPQAEKQPVTVIQIFLILVRLCYGVFFPVIAVMVVATRCLTSGCTCTGTSWRSPALQACPQGDGSQHVANFILVREFPN